MPNGWRSWKNEKQSKIFRLFSIMYRDYCLNGYIWLYFLYTLTKSVYRFSQCRWIMKKYAIIDFLRGFSIFTIALMHLLAGSVTGALSKAAAFGGAGVHVFILCSGFGLYLSYLKKPLRYTDFLKRRFIKVWIPYAIAVLLWGGMVSSIGRLLSF